MLSLDQRSKVDSVHTNVAFIREQQMSKSKSSPVTYLMTTEAATILAQECGRLAGGLGATEDEMRALLEDKKTGRKLLNQRLKALHDNKVQITADMREAFRACYQELRPTISRENLSHAVFGFESAVKYGISFQANRAQCKAKIAEKLGESKVETKATSVQADKQGAEVIVPKASTRDSVKAAKEKVRELANLWKASNDSELQAFAALLIDAVDE
jgi:hypothetical protein